MNESEEDAATVLLARTAITRHLQPGFQADSDLFEENPYPSSWEERRGAFVTLRRHENGALRGCIGFPLPTYPLRIAVARSAVSAAIEDPRFQPVRFEELTELVIEVSVLTIPRLLLASPRSDLPGKILIGRDGLIVEADGTSGLLLPQVAVEQGWNGEEFLNETCVKAGLAPGSWIDSKAEVRAFQAKVYREISPGGPVTNAPQETKQSPKRPAVRRARPR